MEKISIRVKPGCKRESRLERQEDGSFVAFLHARAHDGEANVELIKLVAAEFGVSKSCVTIAVGAKGRQKLIEISR